MEPEVIWLTTSDSTPRVRPKAGSPFWAASTAACWARSAASRPACRSFCAMVARMPSQEFSVTWVLGTLLRPVTPRLRAEEKPSAPENSEPRKAAIRQAATKMNQCLFRQVFAWLLIFFLSFIAAARGRKTPALLPFRVV